jgi:hypothetical protein
MIAPGAAFTLGGRLEVSSTEPDYFDQGVGFVTGGAIAVDDSAPTGSLYSNGLRVNASGALYVTEETDPSDVWVQGLRVSALGQIVIELADPTQVSNGNPITANGLLACSGMSPGLGWTFTPDPPVVTNNLTTSVSVGIDVTFNSTDNKYADFIAIVAMYKVASAQPSDVLDLWDVYNDGESINTADRRYGTNSAGLDGSDWVMDGSVTFGAPTGTFGALSSNISDYRFYILICSEGAGETPADPGAEYFYSEIFPA